jgi:hypothetical protein
MGSEKPQRDVPFFVDVGIALALVLTITFFILVMADRFGVTGPGPGLMQSAANLLVAHEPAKNQHN